MSRKHSRISSTCNYRYASSPLPLPHRHRLQLIEVSADHQLVALDDINEAIFVDDIDASTTQHTAKRKRANHARPILLKELQDHKDGLFRDYQNIFKRQKQSDEAWQWLSNLGIPCHNTPIPVKPHTRAHLHKGALTTANALKDVDFKDVYHAHDVTRSIVSRYCDWKIGDGLPKLQPMDSKEADSIFYTYRNVARKATFSGPCRPSYEEPPTRHDPKKNIDRYVLRMIRGAAVQFQNPRLRVPLEWKTLPEPKFFSLPTLYSKRLAEMKASGAASSKAGGVTSFARELSRPLDDIQESHLVDLLKSSNDGDGAPSVSERKILDLFQKYCPVGNTVAQDIAYQNLQQAQEIVDGLNHPLSLINARREVAQKLNSRAFAEPTVVDFISKEDIRDTDDLLGFGSVLFNDEPTILFHQTAAIALKWANEPGSPPADTETGEEKDVGGLLNKLVTSEEIYISNNGTLSLPDCLQMGAMQPAPDLFSQAEEITSCPRLNAVSPVIFAGECKKAKGITPRTPAQLACALNGTLVLLVLMYLDMRESTEDPLPDWLFVYGIIYTGSGVIIRAHFPTYRYANEEESDIDTDDEGASATPKPAVGKRATEKDNATQQNKTVGSSRDEIPNHQDEATKLATQRRQAVNHGRPRWIFRSVEVTRRYINAFESQSSGERIRLLATLLIIRSHSFLLLEKFKAWATKSLPHSAFDDFLYVLGPD